MGSKYNPRAKADKAIIVLAIPTLIIADATAAKFVGKGNICRIKGTAGGFVTFGESTVGVPSVSTSETIETESGFFQVISTGDYIRTSAAMRIEVIND
jgi:hypothetical protein